MKLRYDVNTHIKDTAFRLSLAWALKKLQVPLPESKWGGTKKKAVLGASAVKHWRTANKERRDIYTALVSGYRRNGGELSESQDKSIREIIIRLDDYAWEAYLMADRIAYELSTLDN